MMVSQGFEHVLAVSPGLLITLPGIDRITLGIECKLLYGLTEGQIGISIGRAQFDEDSGPENGGKPKGERNMLDPGAVTG